jgi:hypothetical protein
MTFGYRYTGWISDTGIHTGISIPGNSLTAGVEQRMVLKYLVQPVA